MNNRGSAKSGGRILHAIALPILAMCFAGCGEQDDRIVEQIVEQTYKIEPDARVTVRNVDGSIRVYGSAGMHEVKIEAIKKAYGQNRLDKIVINVSAQGNSVSIDTIYPPKPKFGLTDRSGTVDYIIVVPESCTIPRLELTNGELLIEGMRGGKVTASLVNGRLYDHNGFGAHQLFVANGGLDVAYDWWEKGQFSIDARIVNGNARAFIPGDASFHLLASTVDGGISSDFSEQEERNGDTVQKIDQKVGDPSESVVQIRATNGSIRIAESNP
jgi:hypothetical protein